jgi:hypothetical protein
LTSKDKQTGIPETQEASDPAAANKNEEFLMIKIVAPLKE